MSFERILNLVYLSSFLLLFLYGQRLQISLALVNVRRSLNRLEGFRTLARSRFLDSILKYNKNKADVENRIQRATNSFTITPVSLDPSGLVRKLEHVLDNYDIHLKTEVRTLATGATETEVNTLTNQLEVSIGLDQMYRVVRHYYLLARKQGGLFALAQLQMALPTIMGEAEAYSAAVDSFAQGKPVGDGVGPMVASRLAEGTQPKEFDTDTVVFNVPLEGRELFVVRAKGPGGNVGKPGSAVERLIKESGPIKLVLTVDAALKLEGELSGSVAEGTGAAIGGPGTERYHIEESATKNGVPLAAVIVQMSSKEAISTMTPQIERGSEEAASRVKNLILLQTNVGDKVIVVGVGNTIGIA